MRAGVYNWKLRRPRNVRDFEDHLRQALDAAEAARLDLLVLPENVTFELRPLFAGNDMRAFATFLADYDFEACLAGRPMAIVGGSHLYRSNGGLVNAAPIVEAGRVVARQEKLVLTQWEIHDLGVLPGGGQALFGGGRLGALVCYDVEFPSGARAIAEAGALALCVPAFTETRAGYQRVRWCAHARAVELQVFVLHASLVGGFGLEPVPTAYGSSAILTPSAEPFPEEAVLAETPFSEESLAVAELDFDALARCRETGDVRNWHDRDKGEWRR